MEFFISKSCTYFIELILICAYQHAFHRLSLLSGLESRSRIDMWKCWGNALILCDTTPLLWLYLALTLSTGHRGKMCHFQCHFLKCTSQGLRVYQQYLKIKEFLLASTFIVYCLLFSRTDQNQNPTLIIFVILTFMNLKCFPCITNLFTMRTLIGESVWKMLWFNMKDNISLSNMGKKTKTARIFTIIIISSHIFFKILGTMDVLNKKID